MADQARALKLADRIKVVVAETLERRIKDPRLGFVTVTDVRVTGDLHEATIFYTVLGDEEAHSESAAALESAKGVLRTEVGKQTGVRFTPTLAFVLDAVPETADAIDELLVSLNSKNHALAVKMANLPEQIKGFGHVKERNLAAVMVQWQSCMDDFRKTN